MQFTLIELWGHMGLFAKLIVFALALMSVSSLIIFGERLVVSFKSRAASRAFAERVGPMLARGEFEGARAAAKPPAELGYLGRVIGAGLAAYASSAPSR